MATTKNITMKQFNGTDYDTLYPETIAAQIPDVYSQNQTLSSSVSALYGLGSNATPNDVFGWIGKYNQYWWLHYVLTDGELVLASNPYVYSSNRNAYPDNGYTSYKWNISLTSIGSDCYVYRQSVESTSTIAYSDNINILSDGSVQLVNPQYVTFTSSSSVADADVLKGKYIQNYPYINFSSPSFKTETVFVPTSATFYEDYDGNTSNRRYWMRIEESSAVITTYVPDSTDYYVYLGIPFENIKQSTKIKVGTYVGTGTHGAANPNILTFDFQPKAIILFAKNDEYIAIMTEYGYGRSSTSNSSLGDGLSITFSGNTVSWCTGAGQSAQGNSKNTIYIYIAIG